MRKKAWHYLCCSLCNMLLIRSLVDCQINKINASHKISTYRLLQKKWSRINRKGEVLMKNVFRMIRVCAILTWHKKNSSLTTSFGYPN